MTGPMSETILRRRRSVGPTSQLLLVIVLGAAVGLGFWLQKQTINAVANGDGFVSAVAAPERVPSDVSGVILPHDIKVGTQAREGQLLFGVEVVTEVTERQESRLAARALRAEIARLEAEAEGLQQVLFPDELTDGDAAKGERVRFAERQSQAEQRRQSLRDSARQVRMDIAEQKATAEQAARARDLAQQELETLGPLVDRGISPKLEFLRVQQKVQELDAQRERAILAVPRLEAAIREIDRKVEVEAAEFRRQAKQLLQEKRRALKAETRAAVKTKRSVARTEIRAPIDGEVRFVGAAQSTISTGELAAIIAPPIEARYIVAWFPANMGMTLRPKQTLFVTSGEVRGAIEAELIAVEAAARNSVGGDDHWAVKLRVSAGASGFDTLGAAQEKVRITATSAQPILGYLWNRIIAASGGRIVERLSMK